MKLSIVVSHLLLDQHLLVLCLDHILISSFQFGLDGGHFLLGQVDIILSCFQYVFELRLILMDHLQLFVLLLQLISHLNLAFVGDVHLVH